MDGLMTLSFLRTLLWPGTNNSKNHSLHVSSRALTIHPLSHRQKAGILHFLLLDRKAILMHSTSMNPAALNLHVVLYP